MCSLTVMAGQRKYSYFLTQVNNRHPVFLSFSWLNLLGQTYMQYYDNFVIWSELILCHRKQFFVNIFLQSKSSTHHVSCEINLRHFLLSTPRPVPVQYKPFQERMQTLLIIKAFFLSIRFHVFSMIVLSVQSNRLFHLSYWLCVCN